MKGAVVVTGVVEGGGEWRMGGMVVLGGVEGDGEKLEREIG